MKNTSATEHEIQMGFWTWVLRNQKLIQELKTMFAIPNGGLRHKAVAEKLKLEGVVSGVPDMCLPVARMGYNCLWLEFKTPKGRLSDNQIKMIVTLETHGGRVDIVRSVEQAIDSVRGYLDV